MKYGRPLFDLVRKSIDYPRGKLVAFNIEAREARGLIKCFSKKDRGSMTYFELVPSVVKEVLNAKEFFNVVNHAANRGDFDWLQHTREAYWSQPN